MSNEERNEYMRNIKWTTGIYFFVSTISIVLSLAGVYYGLKGDIKDSRNDAKEEAHIIYYKLKSSIDSSNNANSMQFMDIREQLKAVPQSKTIIVRPRKVAGVAGMFIERYINGKLCFVPVN